MTVNVPHVRSVATAWPPRFVLLESVAVLTSAKRPARIAAVRADRFGRSRWQRKQFTSMVPEADQFQGTCLPTASSNEVSGSSALGFRVVSGTPEREVVGPLEPIQRRVLGCGGDAVHRVRVTAAC